MEVEQYCAQFGRDEGFESLSPTALSFMEALALPRIHPQCQDGFSRKEDIPLADHAMPSNYFYEEEMGISGQIVTHFWQIAPALLSMGELWLRLFACVIAPLAGTFLIAKEIEKKSFASSENLDERRNERRQLIVMAFGLTSSTVLFTDSLYCHAFGRKPGGILLCALTFLSIKRCRSFNIYKKPIIPFLALIWSLTLYLLAMSNGDNSSNDFGIDISTIEEGLYFSPNNAFMSRVAELWPENTRSYTYEHADLSPFPTGDTLTGFPFLLNKVPNQVYHRRWVQSEVDEEAVAIDIAFPPDGVHRADKTVYLILHGLSGGSHQGFVRELVVRRTSEGNTCIVMIARGMMDTPVFGWNIFHGARVTDADASAKAIRKALQPNQMLAGVGFSMGGIIISNYVARSGTNCALDVAVSISGGLDLRENLYFSRSKRIWQTMPAQTLIEDFIKKKFDSRMRQRLTKDQHLSLMRATSVTEVDVHGIVTYNGFNDLIHYYSEMSAMGDTNLFQAPHVHTTAANDSDVGRIANVSIPLCVLHALDDPIITWRTMGHAPEKLVRTGSGNIMMILTASGGHVGWPFGLNPRPNGWKFMNNVASGFVNSVEAARSE